MASDKRQETSGKRQQISVNQQLADTLQVIKRQILAKGFGWQFQVAEEGSGALLLTPTLSPFCNLNFHEQVPSFVAVVFVVAVVVAGVGVGVVLVGVVVGVLVAALVPVPVIVPLTTAKP